MLNAFPASNSVVVLDNCAIHDKAQLTEHATDVGAQVVFLPPYSPIYNPIECVFGAVKQWLKSNRDIVCIMDPYDAINMALDSITPAHCESWIRHVPFYNVD